MAMALSDNWTDLEPMTAEHRHLAVYYVAVRGTGSGRVRISPFADDETTIYYQISEEDRRNLSVGLARLSALLLAAGAQEVYPGIQGLPRITSELDAIRWLDDLIPKSATSLTTVHAFSSCPAGERLDRTATDSYGRVHKFENLILNDASILPDSPGVNPQGTIMALPRRNVLHFINRSRI